jgi:hypothetical protein
VRILWEAGMYLLGALSRWLFKRWVCPWHDLTWSYRQEHADGPQAALDDCGRDDYQTVMTRYCGECEARF